MAASNANSLQAPLKNGEIITTKITENTGETSVEFLNSDILGFRFKVISYFEGNSQQQVEQHFKKAFYTSMADGCGEIRG
jgi:hypothetical protein